MIHIQPGSSHSAIHTNVGGAAPLPLREQILLESLKDPSLIWHLSRCHEKKRWESTNAASRLDPNDDVLFNGRAVHTGIKPHLNLDWQTTEITTLCTKGDLHNVILKKIQTDSYTHHSHRRMQQTLYTVEFTSLSDAEQRIRIDSTTSSSLATIFENILK